MVMMVHPITKAEYLRCADGTVQVTSPDGISGKFDRRGNWLEGEQRVADEAMCLFVASVSETAPTVQLATAVTHGSRKSSGER